MIQCYGLYYRKVNYLFKFCSHCNTDHPHTPEFWDASQGRLNRCKQYRKDYAKANSDSIRATKIAYAQRNKDRISANAKARYYANHEERKSKLREYAKANSRSEYMKAYVEANRESLRKKTAARMRARRESDVGFRVKNNLSKRITNALTRDQGPKARARTLKLLGCSIEEFKLHIASQFSAGMTWDNYGEWELDHILPMANYLLTDSKTLSVLCKYTNYQPLWKVDNIRKSNKED
jgi:hypothetical protein